MRATRAVLLLVALASVVVAEGTAEGGVSRRGEAALPRVTFTTAAGHSVDLLVEVADTPELIACGLMHRGHLPEDQGMLFVHEGWRGFWNRNTLIPLSVGYIGGGRETSGPFWIVDILEMEATPYPGAPGVIQPDPREPYQFVIEVNAGWYERQGIAIGDQVEVAEAVARGSVDRPPPLCRHLGY